MGIPARVLLYKNFNLTKMSECTLPDDILNEIFLYFWIDKQKLLQIRNKRNLIALRNYHVHVSSSKKTLCSLMLSCKRFLLLARKVLDPSIESDKAYLYACKAGYDHNFKY